jgi:microsomal dipeptidase-like Zn-dependent dipeptidase
VNVVLPGLSLRPDVVEALLRMIYAESDVRGILGEHFLRVFGEAWRQ